MSRVPALVVAACCALVTVSASAGDKSLAFYTANKLHSELLAAQRVSIKATAAPAADFMDAAAGSGYVEAVADSFNGMLFCTPQNVTVDQIRAITLKYLTAHPEKWDGVAAFQVMNALTEAFPCRKAKP